MRFIRSPSPSATDSSRPPPSANQWAQLVRPWTVREASQNMAAAERVFRIWKNQRRSITWTSLDDLVTCASYPERIGMKTNMVTFPKMIMSVAHRFSSSETKKSTWPKKKCFALTRAMRPVARTTSRKLAPDVAACRSALDLLLTSRFSHKISDTCGARVTLSLHPRKGGGAARNESCRTKGGGDISAISCLHGATAEPNKAIKFPKKYRCPLNSFKHR
mmetsp:Transcript_39286/g.82266  ORF Transcript_39286/g.82266 Transcript_39286/m.82266 type:complete len:219 (+) Transcript_39286:103-759(+)